MGHLVPTWVKYPNISDVHTNGPVSRSGPIGTVEQAFYRRRWEPSGAAGTRGSPRRGRAGSVLAVGGNALPSVGRTKVDGGGASRPCSAGTRRTRPAVVGEIDVVGGRLRLGLAGGDRRLTVASQLIYDGGQIGTGGAAAPGSAGADGAWPVPGPRCPGFVVRWCIHDGCSPLSCGWTAWPSGGSCTTIVAGWRAPTPEVKPQPARPEGRSPASRLVSYDRYRTRRGPSAGGPCHRGLHRSCRPPLGAESPVRRSEDAR